MGGIEGFKPYVHPDCTAHHNYDEPEVYIRACSIPLAVLRLP